jgi:hypothetical protein
MAVPAIKSYEAVISLIDHASRKSFIKFDVTQADFVAWATDTSTGNVRTTMDAYEALTLDHVVNESVSEKAYTAPISPTAPSSEDAVNSAKLQILMVDTQGDPLSNTIPARNSANFTSVRGQVIIGTGATAQIATLITEIEAHEISDDGNPVIVKEIKVVGRGTAA